MSKCTKELITLSALLSVGVIVMSEKDSGENLTEETSYKGENKQEAEEFGCTKNNEEREQELEPVPMTRKRPEPKPPSQPAATEKPAAEILKVCSCATSE